MNDAKRKAVDMFVEKFRTSTIATARMRHLALNFIEEYERAFGPRDAIAMVETALGMVDAREAIDRGEKPE